MSTADSVKPVLNANLPTEINGQVRLDNPNLNTKIRINGNVVVRWKQITKQKQIQINKQKINKCPLPKIQERHQTKCGIDLIPLDSSDYPMIFMPLSYIIHIRC